MIKKFWGKNFGVLKEFSVDLSPITLLVGPNASGKSTFLRALRSLAMLTRMPLYVPRGLLPIGYRATLGDFLSPENPDQKIILGVEVESDTGSGLYEITLGYHVENRIKILDERVEWQSSRGGQSFKYDSSTPPFHFDFRGTTVSSQLPRESSLAYLCSPYRITPLWSHKLAPLYELTSAFTPVHIFRFSPSEISRPVPAGTPVSHSGAGLAAELDRLLGEERAKFDKLVSSLKDTFRHIKEVKLVTIKGRDTVLKGLIFERTDGIQVPGELESDGVLLTLAHLWLATRKEPAFGVEEPETATYPSLLESRLSFLRSISEGSLGYPAVQVFVTTHSSLLLTAAQDTGLVRVFEPQEDGSSRIYTPSEEFMQELIYRRLGWATGTEK